jgi:hypothetical protein
MGRSILTAIAAALCVFPGYLYACGSMVQWKGVTVRISCAAFEPARHHLSYQHGALSSIDGRKYSGTGGAIPKLQVQSLSVKFDGSEYVVPQELLRTLYEPVLPPQHRDSLSIQRTDALILVRFSGGDGAGAYEVMWVVNTATSELTRLLYEQPDPGKGKMVRVQLKPRRGIHEARKTMARASDAKR